MRKIAIPLLLFFTISTGVLWWYHQEIHPAIEFPEKKWATDNLPSYTFQMNDVAARYGILVSLEIDADVYPYQNIWLHYSLEDEKGNKINSREVNFQLFDAKTGQPILSGLFPKHRLLIAPPHEKEGDLPGFMFNKKGKYTIRVGQFMRGKGLPGVKSILFSIRKQTKKPKNH